jgi:hypothetical protein
VICCVVAIEIMTMSIIATNCLPPIANYSQQPQQQYTLLSPHQHGYTHNTNNHHRGHARIAITKLPLNRTESVHCELCVPSCASKKPRRGDPTKQRSCVVVLVETREPSFCKQKKKVNAKVVRVCKHKDEREHCVKHGHWCSKGAQKRVRRKGGVEYVKNPPIPCSHDMTPNASPDIVHGSCCTMSPVPPGTHAGLNPP